MSDPAKILELGQRFLNAVPGCAPSDTLAESVPLTREEALAIGRALIALGWRPKLDEQMRETITKEEFMHACEAVWTEIEYQEKLPRRTDEEASDVQGFATLGRVYLRKLEDAWAMNAGKEAALPELRKLAAIFLRGMIYCGIRPRA